MKSSSKKSVCQGIIWKSVMNEIFTVQSKKNTIIQKYRFECAYYLHYSMIYRSSLNLYCVCYYLQIYTTLHYLSGSRDYMAFCYWSAPYREVVSKSRKRTFQERTIGFLITGFLWGISLKSFVFVQQEIISDVSLNFLEDNICKYDVF